MLRGEGEAQPRGALRHGRRPDRDREEAFGSSRREARAPASLARRSRPARSGSAPRGRPAARVKACALQRQRRSSRARVRSGRARRWRRRRSPAAGRSNRPACARGCASDRSPARGAEIAAIGAERLRQRAHLQRHWTCVSPAKLEPRPPPTTPRPCASSTISQASCSRASAGKLGERREIAVHREHAVGDDQARGRARRDARRAVRAHARRRCDGTAARSPRDSRAPAHRQACDSSSISMRSSRADQRRDDAGIGEIAGAEHAGRLGAP